MLGTLEEQVVLFVMQCGLWGMHRLVSFIATT